MSRLCIGENFCVAAESIEGSYHKTKPCRYFDNPEFECNRPGGPMREHIIVRIEPLYAAAAEKKEVKP